MNDTAADLAVTSLPFHPVAALFPLLDGRDLADLTAGIAANGLREPTWLHEGAIIDGRNRYRACVAAGVEPRSREWDGKGSLVAFVLSLNLHRRHLSSSQRAAVAVNALPMLEMEAKQRQRSALIVLVSLLLGTVAVAFYMDWLGLWVSKDEMREQINSSKVRMQEEAKQSGTQSPARTAIAREVPEPVAGGTRG